MQVQPYLMFEGRTEEAIEFYKKTLGAKVEMMLRFKDSPDKSNPNCIPANENLIMHSAFRIGDSLLMASDGMASGKPKFEGITLSVDAKSEAEAKRLFDGLSEGGEVRMPLTKTFFSPSFGMLTDKFGVSWMVMVPQ